MSFTVPEFPITCELWTGPWLTKVIRHVAVPCNLAWGKRVSAGAQFDTSPGDLAASPQMVLLLPKLTDVRSRIISGQGDVVECPSGSGRWYEVWAVDDIGKGFDNEHRAAFVLQISVYLSATKYAGLTPPVPWP